MKFLREMREIEFISEIKVKIYIKFILFTNKHNYYIINKQIYKNTNKQS